MPKLKRPKSWPVKDVRYVEIALVDLTTHQLPLAAQLIERLRNEANSLRALASTSCDNKYVTKSRMAGDCHVRF